MKEMKPPRWCPDAVPSVRGWMNPKTNELLVSMRGLLDNINSTTETEKKEEEVKEAVKTEVKTEVPKTEEVKKEVVPTKKPVKKTSAKKTAKKTK